MYDEIVTLVTNMALYYMKLASFCYNEACSMIVLSHEGFFIFYGVIVPFEPLQKCAQQMRKARLKVLMYL